MSKKTRYRHSQHLSNKSPTNNKLFMIPLIFIIGILPFIMRFKTYNAHLSSYAWFPSSDAQYDIFLYYKQIFFIFICTIMAILIGYKLYQEKKTFKVLPIFIPLITYSVLALLSTIFSETPSFGFKGIFEQFESVFVLLGYCLVVYYAFLFIKTEDDIKFIFKYFMISMLVMIIIGILQAIGHDFFVSDIGKKCFLPREYWNQLDGFNLAFGPKYVYLTLYNPNYVGVYVSLIAPILLCLMLTSKKLLTTILYGVAIIGLLITLLGSKSDAGIIGIAISLIFIIILFRKLFIRNYKFTVPLLFIVLITFILFSSKTSFITNTIKQLKPTKVEYNLTNIKTEDKVAITYKGNNLFVKYSGSLKTGLNIELKDSSNNNVAYSQVDNTFTITDERFSGFVISPGSYNNLLCINIKIDGIDWTFTNQLEDGTYYYINNYGKPDKIIKADSSLFKGYETLASGRGYIWSRTIPLLKNHLLFGSGADTYALVYPHKDYVYLNNLGYSSLILTKPHCMYLQTGVQTGVLSLLALLIFYGMYFCSSLRLYIKGNFNSFFSQVGVSIFIGTIGYMVVGISNDSSITVAPIFWALIGIGIACNYNVKGVINTTKN